MLFRSAVTSATQLLSFVVPSSAASNVANTYSFTNSTSFTSYYFRVTSNYGDSSVKIGSISLNITPNNVITSFSIAGANLTNANLTGATMTNTIVTNTNFSNATVTNLICGGGLTGIETATLPSAAYVARPTYGYFFGPRLVTQIGRAHV